MKLFSAYFDYWHSDNMRLHSKNDIIHNLIDFGICFFLFQTPVRSARALNASYKEQWHRMTSNASHDRESFSNACPRFIYSFQKSLWNHYKLHSSACSDNGLCFTREKKHSSYGILKFEDDFFRNAGQHTRIMHLFVAIRTFGVILK